MLLGDAADDSSAGSRCWSASTRGVSVVRSDPELLQIMDARVSKASALSYVARHYGLTMENVMAIGDAANDIPMLESAGIGGRDGQCPSACQTDREVGRALK